MNIQTQTNNINSGTPNTDIIENKMNKECAQLNVPEQNSDPDPENKRLIWEQALFYHIPEEVIILNLIPLD